MIRNFFKIARWSLLKNKVYSCINIFGLAVGISIAVLISLWVWDELSFDKYHEHYERIAQVMQNQTFNGEVTTGKGNPIPLGNELRTAFGGDFKYVVMSSWSMNTLVSAGDKNLLRQGNYMEPEAPQMLTLNMTEGTRSGLKDLSSILISQALANALFDHTDPLGKLVKLDGELNLKVTGVYQDLPLNSTFNNVSFIAPFWDLYSWTKGQENNWNNPSFQIFVQIGDHANMTRVSDKIKNAKLNKVGSEEAKLRGELFLQPMGKWHLYSEFKNGKNAGGLIQYVWMFAIIGVFVGFVQYRATYQRNWHKKGLGCLRLRPAKIVIERFYGSCVDLFFRGGTSCLVVHA